VEGAGHKWIIFDGVGKADKLGASQPAAIARAFGGVLNQTTDARDCVHVDSGSRRRRVDGAAQTFG
jgi:hypothetical protein